MGCCAVKNRSEGATKKIESEKVDTEQSQPVKLSKNIKDLNEIKDVEDTDRKKKTNKEICKTIKITPGMFIQFKDTRVESQYEFRQKLGEGPYGYVRLAIQKQTGHQRAIKSVEKRNFPKTFSEFKHEFEVLKSLDHPNIVKVYECFEDSSYLHIVTEYIPGGQLIDFIIKQKCLSESLATEIMRQIFSGIGYCHSHNIVHRDLQPENLLLENETSLTLKVIDFVTSSLVSCQNFAKFEKNPSFSAPEVLSNQIFDTGCDMWSCGVIMYLLLSGKLPFYGRNENEIKNRVAIGEYSLKVQGLSSASEEAKDLIRKLLQTDSKKRISAQNALAHPWFQKPQSAKIIETACLKSLSNFRFGQKFQQAINLFVTNNLISKEIIQKMSEQFRILDKNGDGKISKEELLTAYEKMMNADKARIEVEKIMDNIDFNESGFIDFSEFIAACVKAEEVINEVNLNMAFKVFDKDGSGKLAVQEIRELLGVGVNDQEVLDIILKEIDSNGDGEIDLQEFKNIMVKHIRNSL